MDPLVLAVIALGVALLALSVVLVRRWNRKNRVKYPERISNRFFEINRAPRR
jgi:hypothetical protein